VSGRGLGFRHGRRGCQAGRHRTHRAASCRPDRHVTPDLGEPRAVLRGALRPRPAPPGPPSRCSASTTRCPTSATPAATTSSPRRAWAPGWPPRSSPTPLGGRVAHHGHAGRGGRWRQGADGAKGAFDGVDAAMMVHPADADLDRLDASPSRNCSCSTTASRRTRPPRPTRPQRARRRGARLHERRRAAPAHRAPRAGPRHLHRRRATSPTSCPTEAAMDWYVRSRHGLVAAAAEAAGARRLESGARRRRLHDEPQWVDPLRRHGRQRPDRGQLRGQRRTSLGPHREDPATSGRR
jgi:hypothetical protein